jgi:hypothetical protein
LKDGPFVTKEIKQTSKAANLVHAAFLFRKLIEKERLKPVSLKDFAFGKQLGGRCG